MEKLKLHSEEENPKMGDIINKQEAILGALKVEGFEFPATLTTPPGSAKTFFLGGAGVRGLQTPERFIKFTAIGVYLEQETAVSSLAAKWKAKTADQLMDSVEFFRDVVTGPFEKFIRVTMIMPLTGKQYSEKVVENCIAGWKAMGCYTDAEAKAIEEFIQVFKDETFPPSSSILFTQASPTLTIGFSKDGTIPNDGNAKIENKLLSEAFLESIIGEHGVSPEAKRSLAERLSQRMSDKEEAVPVVTAPENVISE